MTSKNIFWQATAAATVVTGLSATPSLADNWNIHIGRDGSACGGANIGGLRIGGCTNKNGGFNGRGSTNIGNGRISVPLTITPQKTYRINGGLYTCEPDRRGQPKIETCKPR